jgi:hypothetical protein
VRVEGDFREFPAELRDPRPFNLAMVRGGGVCCQGAIDAFAAPDLS